MRHEKMRICWYLVAISLLASPLAADLPTHAELTAALKGVVGTGNGGFELNMWATVVDRDGAVQAVTFSGDNRGDQWPGSRVISAQKANTANAFSLSGLALSTANLFTPVQPDKSLFGLQFSNPIDTKVAYGGDSEAIGTANDPMVGGKIGGVNVFGGGLALYDIDGILLGALGLSGDSSCADHNIAWKVRHALNLDNVPAGVSATADDNMVYDIADGVSASGWGHAACGDAATQIARDLPTTHPIGPQATAVVEEHTSSLPQSFALDQNYPNPFNSGTVIRFALPQGDETALSVYNANGQKVTDLVSGAHQAGVFTIHWDGRTEKGVGLASGVYFYRLQAGKHVEMRKLLLLR